MKYIVECKQIKIRCIIGCLEKERIEPQNLIVSLRASYDAKGAAESDLIVKALDYRLLVEELSHTAIEGRFHLLEAYVETSLRNLRKRFPLLDGIWIRAAKIGVIDDVEELALELEDGLGAI